MASRCCIVHAQLESMRARCRTHVRRACHNLISEGGPLTWHSTVALILLVAFRHRSITIVCFVCMLILGQMHNRPIQCRKTFADLASFPLLSPLKKKRIPRSSKMIVVNSTATNKHVNEAREQLMIHIISETYSLYDQVLGKH